MRQCRWPVGLERIQPHGSAHYKGENKAIEYSARPFPSCRKALTVTFGREHAKLLLHFLATTFTAFWCQNHDPVPIIIIACGHPAIEISVRQRDNAGHRQSGQNRQHQLMVIERCKAAGSR